MIRIALFLLVGQEKLCITRDFDLILERGGEFTMD